MSDLLFFRNRNFLLLWLGQLVSNIGTIFYRIAYMWWITKASGSPLVVSQVVLFAMLPGALIGPIAGNFSDKFNKKTIIVTTDLLQGIVILWITYVAYTGNLQIHHFYISAALSSFLLAFFRPAVFSAMPQIVEKEDLVTANSLYSFSRNISNVLAPIIGGLLIASFGVKLAFLINGLSFLISAFSELFIQMPNSISKDAGKKRSLFGGIRGSFAEVLRMPIALYGIIIFGTINFLLTSLNLMTFIAENLGGGASGYGMLRTSEGIGLVVVSLVLSTKYAKNRLKKDILNLVALAIMSLGIFTIGISKDLYLTAVAMLAIGVGVGMMGILLTSTMQTYIKKESLGMFAGIRSTITDLLMPIGLVLSGYFATIFSVNDVLIVVSLLMVTNIIWIIKLNQKVNVINKEVSIAEVQA